MSVLRVPRARHPVGGRRPVPPSKSIHQRLLVLDALADEPARIVAGGGEAGEDVRRLERALAAMGRWAAGGLGTGRESLRLDLGLGATPFRLATAAATLRPAGARTLLTGRPGLLARPHRPLRRALARLGGHVVRRPSGAFRVIGGGVRGRPLVLPGHVSSQYASALLLIGSRIGGLDLVLEPPVVSRPYLGLTTGALAAFGLDVRREEAPGGRLRLAVGGGAPRADEVRVEADASSAVVWWAAAALTGGRVVVPGLPRASAQADVALLGILERMGAVVGEGEDGAPSVAGPGEALTAPGAVDLADAPDLLPLVGALAAAARGRTRIAGVAHARRKESDRVATTAAAIRALGGSVTTHEDGLTVEGGGLRGGRVDVAGDHRIAFAFGVLGLLVGDVVLAGAEAAAKSWPAFATRLLEAAAGDGAAEDGSGPGEG